MTERKPCEARQYSDTMICERCVLQWDVNDDDRPECLTPCQKLRLDHNLRSNRNEQTN